MDSRSRVDSGSGSIAGVTILGVPDYQAESAAAALAVLFDDIGLTAPSLRAIAREAGTSAATLLNWFGDRQSMLQRCALAFAEGFEQDLAMRVGERGWDGFVPLAPQELTQTRSRLAWAELGRADETVGQAVALAVAREGRLLAAALDTRGLAWRSTPPLADPCPHLVLMGIWDALTRSEEALSREDARRVWASARPATGLAPG